MKYLEFRESEEFFHELDAAVKEGPTAIGLSNEKPSLESKLWKRLRYCQGWKEIKEDLGNLSKGGVSQYASIVLSPKDVARLVKAAIVIGSFIAVALMGLLFYSVYKNRKVTITVEQKPDGTRVGRIEIEPIS
jgi:hypothetical protein